MQYAGVAGASIRARRACSRPAPLAKAPGRAETAARGARRGRPPRLTRDQILAAGLSLVRLRGTEALTARALAERLGASPMALYGHFANKQALLAEIAAHAVEKMSLRVPQTGEWRTIIGAWLASIRREFRAHPELLPLLAGEGACSRYILASSARVTEVLTEAGLPRAQAVRAVLGSMWAVIGFVVCESAEKMNVEKVLAALPEEDRDRVQPIARDLLAQSPDAMFSGVLTRLLDGLALELGRAAPPARRARAGRRARGRAKP